jgi:hypothetical protein
MQYAFSFVFLLLKMQKMIFLGETWPYIYIYIERRDFVVFSIKSRLFYLIPKNTLCTGSWFQILNIKG